MTKQITYNTLFMLDQELMQFQKQQPAIAVLLEPRTRFFYQRADIHLKAMFSGMNSIQEKFIQKDDAGKFRTTGEGDKQDWLFVPVYTDFKTAAIIADPAAIKKIYEERVTEFMNTSIKLEL